MVLDETDIKILKILQADARISNQELAERVGISPSPCLRRVRKLEQDGVIERYVTLVNAKAVGRGQQAFIEIRLEHQNRALTERFEAEVQKLQKSSSATWWRESGITCCAWRFPTWRSCATST